MNNLTVFNYEEKAVRTVIIDGEPWWVAKDICEILSIDTSNVSSKMAHVPDEWKGRHRIATPGGFQEMLCVREQGLYFFLARSDKPNALPFQKWISGDVLPSIRRKGFYSVNSDFNVPKTLPEALRLAADLAEKNEQLENQNNIMKPKAEFYDAVAGSKDAIEMSTAAKVLNLGVGRNNLFEILRKNRILRENNEPYQEYIDRGWFRTVEQKYTAADGEIKISIKTLVYQRGLDRIRKIISSAKTAC